VGSRVGRARVGLVPGSPASLRLLTCLEAPGAWDPGSGEGVQLGQCAPTPSLVMALLLPWQVDLWGR